MPLRPAVTCLATLVAAACLAGCGGIPLTDVPPGGFDLSGRWLLDRDESSAPERRGAASGDRFLSQDFPLLVTSEMRIEQDARSMGIEYGRGSYRDISWGERRRGIWEVRAGWHEGNLHIYSEAPDVSAAEVWQLSDGGERLEIDIEVRGNRDLSFRRVFRRASAI